MNIQNNPKYILNTNLLTIKAMNVVECAETVQCNKKNIRNFLRPF